MMRIICWHFVHLVGAGEQLVWKMVEEWVFDSLAEDAEDGDEVANNLSSCNVMANDDNGWFASMTHPPPPQLLRSIFLLSFDYYDSGIPAWKWHKPGRLLDQRPTRYFLSRQLNSHPIEDYPENWIWREMK